MTREPIDLGAALASFDRLWSPRIVTRVNDYDVRVAKVAGEHVWHAHDDTDEFFLVLAGELRIALRDGGPAPEGSGSDGPGSDGSGVGGSGVGGSGVGGSGVGGERVVVLPRGSVFVVPRGVEHRPSSDGGASILMFEPSGTSSVGDRHEEVPAHVDATTGHALG
ncbi:cupin domain-containing protein [Streptosporangium sp. NPDC004379]|uniref:cupin domain-containing protein n=1 Tax=Streptosporangium sp. NPDC004379 TaxID=3366189 RepID=UPI0036B5E8A9